MTYYYYDEAKELDEAINAANNALYHLDQADQLLSKAKNWGMLDILGGGMIVSLVKRDKMTNANREIQESRRALRKLNRELEDIHGYNAAYDLEMDSLLGISDVWLDNVVSDVMTQNRINKTVDWVRNSIAEVEGLLDGLEERRSRI